MSRLGRIRTALLVLVALGFTALAVELLLESHWGSAPQVLPFVLCGLGLIASITSLISGAKPVLWATRGVFGLQVVGGLFGVWEHLEHNAAFAAEIAPNASTLEWVFDAIAGANPLLAPLAFVGLAGVGLVSSWARDPTADAHSAVGSSR